MLLAGVAALVVPSLGSPGVSWSEILAPYSGGVPLLDEFRIAEMSRGPERDVIVRVVGPNGQPATEVHILPRGMWPEAEESRSFGVDYELPRSPSARSRDITRFLTETLRARDIGLPSPDLIPLSPGPDATVVPWWLDNLRSWRGLLIGVDLLLLGWFTLVPSRSLGLIGAAVGTGILVVAFGIPEGRPDLFGSWSLPAAVILLWFGARDHVNLLPADRLAALAILVVALGLRVVLGPWGPMHVNGYGPRFIAGVLSDPAAIASYGPGYVELFSWLPLLATPSPDSMLFAFNAILSALAVTLAFVLARFVGIACWIAVAAAVLLAIDPVAIRCAATESYFPSILFLSAAASVALLIAARALHAGDGWGASLCVTGAALLLVQATRVHPAAWLPAAIVPFFLCAGEGRTRMRCNALLGGVLVIGGVLLATSGDALAHVLENIRGGVLMHRPAVSFAWPLMVAVALAGVCGLGGPSRRLAPVVGVCGFFLLMTRHLYGQSWIWQQSYDRLFLTVPVVAIVAALLTPFRHHRGLIVALALVAATTWMRIGLPVVSFRTTDHLEYTWLRDRLRLLPRECRVVHLAAAGDRGVEIPTFLRATSSPAIALDPRRPREYEMAFSPAPCIYYVHTSLCSSLEARAKCEGIEDRVELEIVAREAFPARPSSPIIPYDRDPVETWIGRVVRGGGGIRPES